MYYVSVLGKNPKVDFKSNTGSRVNITLSQGSAGKKSCVTHHFQFLFLVEKLIGIDWLYRIENYLVNGKLFLSE